LRINLLEAYFVVLPAGPVLTQAYSVDTLPSGRTNKFDSFVEYRLLKKYRKNVNNNKK